MLDDFKPTWMVESLYHISPEKLKENGIDTILTDLDNTLIPWNNSIGTNKINEWIRFMKENGINVIVVSNNNPKRVGIAVEKLDIPFVAHALKPLNRGIKQTLKRFKLMSNRIYMSRNSCVFTTFDPKGRIKIGIYMSRNSRVFTTKVEILQQEVKIYMSRNSRVFTTFS